MEQKTTWVGKTYTVEGTWAFVEKDGNTYLEFGEDFQTNPGPDVKIYLTKVDVNEIGNRDLVDLEGVFISELKNFSGKQQFRIPNDVNIDDFKSIVIHCKRYSVVWGGVNIS